MPRRKRRLKKSVRLALHRAKMICVSAAISATVTPIITNTAFSVKAETLNQNFAIKTTATLQHTNLSNATTLKDYVVNDYNSKNAEKIDSSNTKVIITAPTVVTNPTIENVTFTVEEKEDTETTKTEDTNETKSSEPVATPSTTSESETAVENKDNKATTSEEKIEEVKQETEKKDKDTIVDESSNSDKDEMSADSKKVANIEENTNTSTKTETKTFQDVMTSKNRNSEIGEISSIVSDDGGDLDEIASEVEEKINVDVTKPLLELTETELLITDGSTFTAEDYIKTISDSNGNLPTLKIEGTVNTMVDGEYDVVYTAVDTKGSSTSSTLHVTVQNSEESIKVRNEKKQQALDSFVAETSGKHIDEDGYYGDQCWDLWGYFNRTKKLTDFDDGCSPYGYVYGIPLKYKTSGASKYYKYIKAGETLQAGDWLFWNKGSSYSDSHVALLLGINEDGTLKCLTQSYGEGTRILDLQPDIMAAFRLKDAYQWWNY